MVNMEDDEAWTAAITRTPTSTNDTLNVYVFPEEGNEQPISNYDLTSYIKYGTIFDGLAQSSTGVMRKNERNGYFYQYGVSANEMRKLNVLTIEANIEHDMLGYLDHAIIQRVRSGVLVETMYFDFSGGSSTAMKSSSEPCADPNPIANRQTIQLKIANTMAATALVNENRDLAIAIRYTSSLDHRAEEGAGNEMEYISPYFYLTDAAYNDLAAGNLLTINTYFPHVKEIKGMALASTGGLKVQVQSAIIATYEGQVGTSEEVCTQWYNFSLTAPVEVSKAVVRLEPNTVDQEDMDALTTFDITIKAPEGFTGSRYQPPYPIKTVIGYISNNGTEKEFVIEDLRKEEATAKGSKRDFKDFTASVMLPGVREVRWVSVEPYDDNAENALTWNPGPITFQTNNMTGSKTKTCGDNTTQLYETVATMADKEAAYRYPIADVSVYVAATTYNLTSGETTRRETQNGTIDLLVDSGQFVSVTPQTIGSAGGFVAKAEKTLGDATEDANNCIPTDKTASFDFETPENLTNSPVAYRITVSSMEIPTAKVVINITVMPRVEQLPDEGRGEQNSGTPPSESGGEQNSGTPPSGSGGGENSGTPPSESGGEPNSGTPPGEGGGQ